jgi:hypothetical protein
MTVLNFPLAITGPSIPVVDECSNIDIDDEDNDVTDFNDGDVGIVEGVAKIISFTANVLNFLGNNS